jgi:hypothetical protein
MEERFGIDMKGKVALITGAGPASGLPFQGGSQKMGRLSLSWADGRFL